MEPWPSPDPAPPLGRLPPVTLVRRVSPSARAFEAHLCDAGRPFAALASLELEVLHRTDSAVVVVFVGDFLLTGWVAALKALHSRRPDLVLVCVAGLAERSLLCREFQGAVLPPLVLSDSAPAVVLHEALQIAHDAHLTESLVRPLDRADVGKLADTLAEVSTMLTRGGQPLHDHVFDRLLPMRLRAASSRFWTPLDVVRRATTWLDELNVQSVVDIGAGVGKFCIAGAFTSSCTFIGIEQRPQVATVARNLARLLAVDERVSIIEGSFGEIAAPPADCYYLYNPFEENLFAPDEALDEAVELTPDRFRRDLRSFRALVATLPVGALVLTYNGVGSRLPKSLAEERVDRTTFPAALRLLRKVH